MYNDTHRKEITDLLVEFVTTNSKT